MNFNMFLKNKTVKNAGWIIGGRVAQMLINLVVGLMMARYLGPSNYGLIHYGGAYTAFFASFCTLGINSLLVKEFVDHPEETGKIIGTSLFLRIISSILSAFVIVCICFFVDAGEKTTMVVVGLCSIGMIFQVFEVIKYWFQSQLKSKVTALITLIAYIITSLYKVVLMILDKSVEWFAAATAVDYICIAIMLLYVYKKYNGGKLSISIEYGKDLLKRSWHFILPGLMVAIYSQTDKIMLKQLISDAEIGYYSTAVSLSTVWCFVLSAIIDSVYPSIMQAYNTNKELFIKRNKQLYAIVFYICACVSVIFIIFAELIIMILYGHAYMPAAAPLRVITLYTAFSYIGVARNAWIVCENRQKYLVYIYVSSAIANVLLNIILIPTLGSVGAAIASLVAQVMTCIIVPFFIKDLRENSKMIVEAILLRGIK